jgi:general secretion pathway protein D
MAACAVTPVDQSRDLWNQGRYEESVQLLRDASASRPDDRPLLAAYHRQRDRALAQLFVAAENSFAARRLDEAQDLFQRALRLDPESDRAREGLQRVDSGRRLDAEFALATKSLNEDQLPDARRRLLRILAFDSNYRQAKRLLQQIQARERDAAESQSSAALRSALATPVSIEFRETPMRNVFEVLSRTAGLNFVFDHDVKTDTKITIFIRNNPIEDVLKVLLSTNALDRKVLNENTLLVYPNTAAKAKEYQELVVRTFYLVNAEAKQVEAVLRTVVHLKDVYIDEKINTVIVRDTPDAVRLAEQVVQSVDIADAEVMLELSVIELSHTRALNLGLQLPTSVTRGSLTPIVTTNGSSGSGSPGSSSGSILTSQLGTLVNTIPNPLLVANLAMTDTDSNLLANPRIRVRNREKAKVLIGEKLPVITSTAVQNAGVASSVSYLDVGLKLEVEPQVYLDDEVGIKLQLEVNSNLGAVTVGNSTTGVTTAYQVGTRTAQTNLRLRDGETQVLAGLINDNESDSWNKVPGLSDLPVLGRLFSNDNSSHEKTEIVLLVTPHILRNLATPDGNPLTVSAGTEAAIGAQPLHIGPTPAQSLSLRGPDGAGRPGPLRHEGDGAPASPDATPAADAAVAAPAAAPAATPAVMPLPSGAPAPASSSVPPTALPSSAGTPTATFPAAPGSEPFAPGGKDPK